MSQKQILVIEDNAITRKMVRIALQSNGYSVLEAPTGQAALALLNDQVIDLVLIDLVLPDCDGNDLMVDLRKAWTVRHGQKDLPIVAVSGYFAKTVSNRSTHGFTASLQKPVEPSQLLHTVKALLMSKEASPHVGRGQRIVLADDNPVQAKLLKLQLSENGFEVKIAKDGAEALDLALKWRPHGIVADLLMPKIDGFRLCLAVRQNAELKLIPVILHSSVFIEDQDRALAESVGCSAFLPRTPDSRSLIDALMQHLGVEKKPIESAHTDQKIDPKPDDAYIQRIIGQIERQVGMNKDLGDRLNLLQAQLSLMSGFADELQDPPTCHEMLQTLVETSFHVTGISQGIAYTLEVDGTYSLSAACGFTDTAGLTDFFGKSALFANVTESGKPVQYSLRGPQDPDAGIVLERLHADRLVIAPLTVSSRSTGTLVIISEEKHLSDDWSDRALALGAQIGQSMAIVRIMGRVIETCSRMVHSAKFAALGEMAGGVAHEINNPMAIIIGKCRQLSFALTDDTITPENRTLARKCATALTETADRVVKIVHGLQTISRTSDNDPFVKTKLKAIFADAIALSTARFKYQGIDLSVAEPADDLEIECRPTRIVQLLVNLLNNAYDAIETLDDKWIKITVQPFGECVDLLVTDSGPGIPPDLRARIMQPFFTTKEAGRGTGLGLSITKGIIDEHHGVLLIDETCPNTRFVVRLPTAQDQI